MHHRTLHSRTLHLACAAAALSTLLTACGSSSPGVSEIENMLAASYQCSPFVVKSVKKLDGASVSDNLYDVTFSYELEFKGGQSGALNFHKEYQRRRALQRQNIRTEFDDLIFGGCTSPRKATLLSTMYETSHIADIVEERLKANPGPVPIPYAAKMPSAARARKAESGWVIVEVRLPEINAVVDSAPQVIAQ